MSRFIRFLFVSTFIVCAIGISAPAQPAQAQGEDQAGCLMSASGRVTIFTRPSTRSDVWFVETGGFSAGVAARAAGSWLGFDPGVAQAANIGPFRLRWVQRKDVRLSGDCSAIPRVWAPPPGICFDMPMQDVNVYEHPRTSAKVLVVLHPEEFAAVGRRSGLDWVKVDLRPGNTGSKKAGWVEANTLNVNGPCR